MCDDVRKAEYVLAEKNNIKYNLHHNFKACLKMARKYWLSSFRNIIYNVKVYS